MFIDDINDKQCNETEEEYQKRKLYELLNGLENSVPYEKATVVEGQYAEDIKQALLRPPSQAALDRNKKAQALLRKLRR